MWIYKNQIYKNQKEIKAKLNISTSVLRAKIRDKEIVRIGTINTGVAPYEKLYNSTE